MTERDRERGIEVGAPVPLAAPDGTVMAYACGRCRRVRGGSEYTTTAYSDEQVQQMADLSRSGAARCCTCDDCGVQTEHERRCPQCERAHERRMEELRRQHAERDAAHEIERERSLQAARDRGSALALESAMRGISERDYCAGWLSGLEDALWGFVEGGPGRFGMGRVEEDDIATLRSLAEAAGGWWHWPDDEHGRVGPGTLFVPLDEWHAMYHEHDDDR